MRIAESCWWGEDGTRSATRKWATDSTTRRRSNEARRRLTGGQTSRSVGTARTMAQRGAKNGASEASHEIAADQDIWLSPPLDRTAIKRRGQRVASPKAPLRLPPRTDKQPSLSAMR
uniref:Uncharacterized protein n=1 Tax=Plectus sambesii TaxID=2011161 RepID=A0A914XQ71_9BILA